MDSQFNQNDPHQTECPNAEVVNSAENSKTSTRRSPPWYWRQTIAVSLIRGVFAQFADEKIDFGSLEAR
jgi:hypothetical protein